MKKGDIYGKMLTVTICNHVSYSVSFLYFARLVIKLPENKAFRHYVKFWLLLQFVQAEHVCHYEVFPLCVTKFQLNLSHDPFPFSEINSLEGT